MKTIIFTVLTCFIISTGFSQTQQGNVLIGADLANFDVNFQKDNTQFGMDINPKAAWFISDNTALGVEVLFGLNTQKGATAINYGLGAIGRRYMGTAATNLARTMKWFVEVNAG